QPPTGAAGSPPAPVAAAKQPSPPASHDHGTQTTAATAPPPAATSAPVATAVAATPGGGDAAAGRLVYRKCQACHSMDTGKNMLGPSLAGIRGRKAGAEPGYNYSAAMKQSGLVWDDKTLDAYLADPQKLVPGNKMPFPGLKTDHDRADIIAYLAASAQPAPAAPSSAGQPAPGATAKTTPAPASPGPQSAPGADITYIPDAKYTLRSGIAEGRMVYIGVGGGIDGHVNPVLTASEGQVVQVTLINGEGAEHDIVFPDQDAKSLRVTGKGASTTIAFRATKSGDFIYLCSVPGHQLAGMQGQFLVTPRPTPQTLVEADISRANRPAATHRQARPANGSCRPIQRRNRRSPRRRHHVRLLDFQWQGAGAVHPRACRRHHRHPREEFGRQLHDPFGRFPCNHRTRRRRSGAPGRSGKRKIDDVEGIGAGTLCLPLRHADGRRAHCQRHVRAHPGRTRRRSAAGRSRVLCDAGRNLHRYPARPARQRRVQRGEAFERAPGVFRPER